MTTNWRNDYPEGTNPFKFFLFASRPHIRFAIPATLAVLVAGALYSSTPYIFKLIANAAAGLPYGGPYEPLIYACVAYILALAAAKGIWRVSGFLGSYWATGARATARHALTSYVTLHSRSYFSDRFAGSLGNKITHAANGMLHMVEQILWQLMEFLVASIASFIIAFTASATLAGIFLAWLLAVAALNVYLVQKRVPIAARSQQLETGLNGSTVDLMTNISTMQEYARRRFEIDRLKAAIDERRKAGLRNWHFGERMLALNNVLQVIFGSAMVYAAVRFAQTGAISPGDVVLVITIIFSIERLFQSIGSQLNSFAETWGEIQESLQEIVAPHDIPDRPGAKPLAVQRGEIALENLVFSYGAMKVFPDLSLTIPAGQRVGLVGRSGAGKSTLMRLLLRHHDLDSGTIKIDGVDIAGVTQESLRASIAVVPQEPLLFHRTVRENIAYGKPQATAEEIVEAAKRAHADEFVKRLASGYESLVGERGVKLSGGERQRIAIARAILKNSPILLLDEATSALDSESEGAIQAALHALMKGKTVIAIAHRLSTLREMDRIIVLERGAVIEDGTHDELLHKGGQYAALWERQAGGFLKDA
ncbi:MAG: ABC transporter ATP-binding protein [Candidatus Kaiserbacteria bacterium]|nr:MAG: ABC transporter ATP-binding protein [Candidatus Kaiserbacteria bacterium]